MMLFQVHPAAGAQSSSQTSSCTRLFGGGYSSCATGFLHLDAFAVYNGKFSHQGQYIRGREWLAAFEYLSIFTCCTRPIFACEVNKGHGWRGSGGSGLCTISFEQPFVLAKVAIAFFLLPGEISNGRQ